MSMPKNLRIVLLLAAAAVFPAAAAGGNAAAEVSGQSGISSRAPGSSLSQLPAFALPGLDGATHRLEEWEGKVLILNFWASWCSPCLYEIRDFVAYQERYQARGLQIIGIGLDDANKLRNVQRSFEINFPVLVADPATNSGMMQPWGNSSGIVPFSVVIGRDGHVVNTYHGPISRESFDEDILPLLGKS